jgi:hypothetical protein
VRSDKPQPLCDPGIRRRGPALDGGSFSTRDVQVLWPKKLYPQLQAEGLSSAEAIDDIRRRLAKALAAVRRIPRRGDVTQHLLGRDESVRCDRIKWTTS